MSRDIKQLNTLKFVPVYVRSTGDKSLGLDELRKKGAILWPNPQNTESFEDVFSVEVRASIAPQQGDLLALPATDVPIVNPAQQAIRVTSTMSDVHGGAEVKQLPADELFMVARKLILQLLTDTPKKDKEIARELGINSAQTKAWLERLVNEKKIEKRTCPVSYTLRSVHDYK